MSYQLQEFRRDAQKLTDGYRYNDPTPTELARQFRQLPSYERDDGHRIARRHMTGSEYRRFNDALARMRHDGRRSDSDAALGIGLGILTLGIILSTQSDRHDNRRPGSRHNDHGRRHHNGPRHHDGNRRPGSHRR